MKLIVVNSTSLGNAYALDAGGEILLLEAGKPMADVKRVIDYRIGNVVGCAVTHTHGDHSKYAGEYARFGVKIFCNQDVADNKKFKYGQCMVMQPNKTYKAGGFYIVPFENFHDVPIFGYLIKHKDMGTLLFSTDSYKIGATIKGVDHYLIEANYSDTLLKENVWSGKINKSQADRIMLSHMSLDYCCKYLKDCDAQNAKTITICHLSERNSNSDEFRNIIASAFGVPTYTAYKGLVVELNKEII